MRVRPRTVVLSLLGLVVAGVLLLLSIRANCSASTSSRISSCSNSKPACAVRSKSTVSSSWCCPAFTLELTNVGIYGHDDPTHVVFSAKEIDIVLRLLPLLKKQVVAKRIFLNEPTVTLIRSRSGHWNVLAGLPWRPRTSRPIRCSAACCRSVKQLWEKATSR